MDRYDIYAQFAQRHLATPAEQAVYAALVSHQGRLWSATDLGSQAALAPAAAARILRQYAAAGIVEEAEDGRYRWRADLSYLFGNHGDGPASLDPVCDMPVTADSPYRSIGAQGRVWRFCSSVCLAAFTAAPQAFSRSATV